MPVFKFGCYLGTELKQIRLYLSFPDQINSRVVRLIASLYFSNITYEARIQLVNIKEIMTILGS